MLWVQVDNDGPSARAHHAMVFDGPRRRTVLFGGAGRGGPLGDTWAWDGDRWVQVDEIGPAPRVRHAMAFDETLGLTVLFGGHDAAGDGFGDTWGWDGTSWTQLSDLGPRARWGHGMAFDPKRERVLLFAGRDGGGLFGDTWAWDGNVWTQVQDIGPPPRSGHLMAFDHASDRVLLVGGHRDGGVDPSTWEWDGEHWAEVVRFGPAPRADGASFSFGTSTVLFGGVDPAGEGLVFADTWEWVDRRWTQRQDIGPSPRTGHAAVLDTSRARAVLFGGSSTAADEGGSTADTWELVATTADGRSADEAFDLSLEIIQQQASLWRIVVGITLHVPVPETVQGFASVQDANDVLIGAPQTLSIPAMSPTGGTTFVVAQKPITGRAALNIGGRELVRTATF